MEANGRRFLAHVVRFLLHRSRCSVFDFEWSVVAHTINILIVSFVCLLNFTLVLISEQSP
jgi:hypothetical protein